MNKKQIEQALRDYHWMLRSIKMAKETLSADDSYNIKVTAQYGEEAAMPKRKGTTSDPVLSEVVRRSKYWQKVEKYEATVKLIQDRIHLITDNREQEVLHWLLEGESYSWIARHMGLSERHIRRIKDSIVEQMSNMPSSPRMPKTSSI